MKAESVIERKRKDGTGVFWVVKLSGDEKEYLCFDPAIKNMSGSNLDGFVVQGNYIKRAGVKGSTSEQNPGFRQQTKDYKAMLIKYACDLTIQDKTLSIDSFSNKEGQLSVTLTCDRIKRYYYFLDGLHNVTDKRVEAKPETTKLIAKIGEYVKNPTAEQISFLLSKLSESKNTYTADDFPENLAPIAMRNLNILMSACMKEGLVCKYHSEEDNCSFIGKCIWK